jgi:hypothetical protein
MLLTKYGTILFPFDVQITLDLDVTGGRQTRFQIQNAPKKMEARPPTLDAEYSNIMRPGSVIFTI